MVLCGECWPHGGGWTDISAGSKLFIHSLTSQRGCCLLERCVDFADPKQTACHEFLTGEFPLWRLTGTRFITGVRRSSCHNCLSVCVSNYIQLIDPPQEWYLWHSIKISQKIIVLLPGHLQQALLRLSTPEARTHNDCLCDKSWTSKKSQLLTEFPRFAQ